LRKIEARGVFAGAQPASGESAARFAERTQATLGDLATCTPPRNRPIEPCANPQRIPNLLIFRTQPLSTDELRRKYVARLQEAVQMNWLRPNTKTGLRCTVHVTQKIDGAVVSSKIGEPCNADAATRKSLVRAVQMASPLPHEGFDKVFEREVDLVFVYGD